MKLDVRVAHAGAAADEAAGLEVVAGAEAVMPQQPAHADQRTAQERDLRVERDRLAGCDLEVELEVILEILTHAAQLVHERQAEGSELRRRSDAGQLKQLPRVDRG